MVAHDGVDAQRGMQARQRCHEGTQLVAVAVHYVAGEHHGIGPQGVDDVDGAGHKCGVAPVASHMPVAYLHYARSAQFGWQARDVDTYFLYIQAEAADARSPPQRCEHNGCHACPYAAQPVPASAPEQVGYCRRGIKDEEYVFGNVNAPVNVQCPYQMLHGIVVAVAFRREDDAEP